MAVIFVIALLGCYSTPMIHKRLKAQDDASQNQHENRPQLLPVSAKAFIKGEMIELEVAWTPAQIASGLMHRDALPDNRGMLFILEPAEIARFWMKDVSIYLDMIFLREGEITDIAHFVPPCRSGVCPLYGPDCPVDQVIELRGGRAEELGLEAGDSICVEFLNVDQ